MAEEVAFKLFGTRIVMDASLTSRKKKIEDRDDEELALTAEAAAASARDKICPTSPSPSPSPSPPATKVHHHHTPSDKAAAVAAAAAAAAAAVGLPCPRCKSKETKFCYFNNYNVNQPRHFCRGCQRYWTAGGALRNVPVGAGRRKARPPPVEGAVMAPEERIPGIRVSTGGVGGGGVAGGGGGVFGFSAGLEGVMVQQWLGFPAKRPNTSLPDRIR